jgi:hypothetical protein
MNRSVIYINKPQVEEKPVLFSHAMTLNSGWSSTGYRPSDMQEVVYLGKCKLDGDMFSAKHQNGNIMIFKGHLNSGKY